MVGSTVFLYNCLRIAFMMGDLCADIYRGSVQLKCSAHRERSQPKLVSIVRADTRIIYHAFSLTLIQLCGVCTDREVTKIVTLLEWKVINKSPLA